MATSHKRDTNARPGLRAVSTLRHSSRSSSATHAGRHVASHRTPRRVPHAVAPFSVSAVKVIAAPLAVAATIAGAWSVIDVAAPDVAQPVSSASANLGAVADSVGTGSSAGADRAAVVSRSKDRDAEVKENVEAILESQEDVEQRAADEAAQEATRKAVAGADTELWTTEVLNLWTAPAADAAKIGEIDAGEQVLVTGRADAGREEIVIDGRARWVSAGYLSEDKPVAGIGGTCSNGSSVSGGVSSSIVKVHNAVCAAFPSISTYGTLRGGGGDHPQGRAVDIMVSGALGYQVADFVRAHASELGVSYVIYAQRIWSVERGGEGWRGMSNRGSATANHYDHVHVSVF